MGADVALALRIYARERSDARALSVAELIQVRLPDGERSRYGVLLELEATAFPRAALEPSFASEALPRPDDEHELIAPCLDEALACVLSEACVDFATERGRGGYVLTHQAVWLLFARWTGCEAPFDVDARRREIAADLAAEMALHPAPNELAYERMAMLGQLGFSAAVRSEWLDAMLDAQDVSGCWTVDDAVGCHPHPTAVALWALAHAP